MLLTSSLRLKSHLPRLSQQYCKSNFIRMSSSMDNPHEWPVNRVRSKFIDYFVSKHNHVDYKSSPVVLPNDPSLLFANAGMNQFKPIFLGTVEPSSPYASLKRVVNSQKCIRAGGKHNDLDDVGKDTYHHTFFEMLGTWSFGNYFKQEAIDWAYDILVNTYKLPPERLYVTYFGGDSSLGLPVDEEAKNLWLKYLPKERVLRFDKKDNFWEMGETGPCGPCSEIHFDRIGNRDASKLVNADDPDVIEIWNLVFIQYNREKSGELRLLPNKHIDTGMGLERLVSILQNKTSNYDTDVFSPIFKSIQQIVKCDEYSGKVGIEDAKQGFKDTAYRVIADHIRTLSIAIADGTVPSNDGRGYVLRRILRRAVRYGIHNLQAKQAFFARLVPVVVKQLGDVYPQLKAKENEIISVIEEEEKSFSMLVGRGIKYFNDAIVGLSIDPVSSKPVLPGDVAFYLYDSLGFPIDLTQIMANEKGIVVDIEGYHSAMNTQKIRSRSDTRTKQLHSLEMLSLSAEHVSTLQKSNVLPTNDVSKYSWNIKSSSFLQGILNKSTLVQSVDSASFLDSEPRAIGIILDSSPFYSESGGQIADTGELEITSSDGENIVFDVVSVQSFGGYVLHLCVLSEQSATKVFKIAIGSTVTSKVDYHKRRNTAPNHTMTHVLNHALRQELNLETLEQKGSLVTNEKLRFDFNMNRGMTVNEIVQVEDRVNRVINSELEIHCAVLPLEKALKINGLRAVFGEVYPDPVRVVSIGADINDVAGSPSSEQWRQFSIEFCGGTHISNTRDAIGFAIIEETAVAKGIRRISAVTGNLALVALENSKSFENEVKSILDRFSAVKKEITEYDYKDYQLLLSLESNIISLRKAIDDSVISYATKLIAKTQLEKIQKAIVQNKEKHSILLADASKNHIFEVINSSMKTSQQAVVLCVNFPSDSRIIRKTSEEIKKVTGSKIAVLVVGIDRDNNRVNVFSVSPENSTELKIQAIDWVNHVLSTVGSRGGGNPNQAQGNVNGIENSELLESAAKTWLLSKLN